MKQLPIRLTLTAALTDKGNGQGYSAKCLEAPPDAPTGLGDTSDEAVEDLGRQLKEYFRKTPPPVSSRRWLITSLDVEFSTYDLARLCQHVKGPVNRRADRTGTRIAARLGQEGLPFTRSYVDNLVRCVKRLHPVILRAWEENDPDATTDRLNQLASLSRAEQVRSWKGRKRSRSSGTPREFPTWRIVSTDANRRSSSWSMAGRSGAGSNVT